MTADVAKRNDNSLLNGCLLKWLFDELDNSQWHRTEFNFYPCPARVHSFKFFLLLPIIIFHRFSTYTELQILKIKTITKGFHLLVHSHTLQVTSQLLLDRHCVYLCVFRKHLSSLLCLLPCPAVWVPDKTDVFPVVPSSFDLLNACNFVFYIFFILCIT